MHFIIPENRDQYTLYGKLDDLISREHPIRLLDALVDNIVTNNMGRFTLKGQSDIGRRAFHPAVLAKLYLYGYCNRITSSRRLEAECYRNIELIWLLGGLKPDHKTIADYRKDYGDAIRFITIEFRKFLKEKGYIKGETISLDGSKIKANANKEMLSIEKIEKILENLEGKLEAYLDKLNTNDLKEDQLEELDECTEEESKEFLIDKIVHLQQTIEKLTNCKERIEEQGTNFIAPTDSDARLMKSRDGKVPGYNAQVGVDAENKMIVLGEVTNDQVDQDLLEPAMDQLKEQLNVTPENLTADKGYYNIVQMQHIEANSMTTCYVPPQENAKKRSDQLSNITFTYNPEKDEYICSEGKTLELLARDVPRRNRIADRYIGIECKSCAKRASCTTSKRGRMITRYKDEEWVNNYKIRMASSFAKKMSKLRKSLAEHVFGTIKIKMGKIPLLVRGKPKVQVEFDIYATSYNFIRLVSLKPIEILLNEVRNYQWNART